MRNFFKTFFALSALVLSVSVASAIELPISWTHNGSTMQSRIEGERISIEYSIPSYGMRNLVSSGTNLVYGGISSSGRIFAQATIFSRNCGATKYSVVGDVTRNGETYFIDLYGATPILDGRCNITGYNPNSPDSHLRFIGRWHD